MIPFHDRIWRHAEEVAPRYIRHGAAMTDEARMWGLLRASIPVLALAYDGPPRSGYPTKWSGPETTDDITYWQRMAAYLRGDPFALDDVAESRPPQPSAAEITIAEVVIFDLWHKHALIGSWDYKIKRQAVYSKACGMKDADVRWVTGFDREAIKRSKSRAMSDMIAAMRK